MHNRGTAILCVFLLAVVTSCTAGTTTDEPPDPARALLSAEALSPSSVRLEWPPIDDAESYILEGRYGDDKYFLIGELPPQHNVFTHFLVPGSTGVDYRLSVRSGAQVSELEGVSVDVPEFAPNPVVVEPQAFAPTIEGLPEFPVLPTIDRANPDMSVMATAIAAVATGVTPGELPEARPVSAELEVSPEGGAVTVTDPKGVVYTLTLPAGAVEQPTTISLTPIESLRGFPFAGGSLGAVQIHPPMPFAGPLELMIALPADSPAATGASIVGFAVSGFNHELSLAPIYDHGQNTYSMDVYWGDTIGLASATLDEVAAQAARIPTDPGRQMAQQLAALLAFNPDRSPEAEFLIAAQVVQGLQQNMPDLTARTSPNRGPGLAASVSAPRIRPMLQGQNAVRLLLTIVWSEPIWDFLNQMLPTSGFESIPSGNETATAMAAWRERIVTELTQAIKAYMDEHDGCRTGLALHAEALRQILRRPATPFRQALASNYRSRYGPPPELQCEFRLQIVRSSIKEEIPSQGSELGDSIRTYGVHSEPWTLELEVQEGRLFLRGPVGTQYDAWDWTLTNCPPTVQLRPFPTSLIWITDLAMLFDDDDRVSDFVLQGVTPDRVGGSGDGMGETDTPEPGKCRLVKVNPGANPTDVWGIAFSSLHNRARKMDNWVITGEDSYVATDTLSGRVEGGSLGKFTEDTTIVLTVNQR